MNNKTAKSFIGDKVNVEVSVIFIIIASFEVISGTVGNTVLLLILRKPAPGRRVNSHSLLLANLALANLFSMGYWMPFFVLDLLLGYHPVANEVHCALNGYLIVILTLVALLSLISISFNRYLQVCHSHIFKRIVTNAGTISWCAFCWVACLAICAPYIREDVFRYAYIPSIHQCSIDRQTGRYVPVNILVDSLFCVPTVAVVYWNYAILRQWRLTRVTRAKKRAARISATVPCYSVQGVNKVAAVKVVVVGETTEDLSHLQSDLEKQPEVQGEVSHSPKESPGNMCSQESYLNQGSQIGHGTEFSQGSKFSQGPEFSQGSKFNQETEMSLGSKFNQGTEISQGSKFIRKTKPIKASDHLKELERLKRVRLEKEREVVMSIVGVCLLMFFTYVPVFIIQTVDLFYEVPPPVKLFIFLIFHFNSAINWVVYGSMNRFIRRGCSRYVIKLRRTYKCKTLCSNRVQGQ